MTICKRTGVECDRMCMDFCNIAETRIVELEAENARMREALRNIMRQDGEGARESAYDTLRSLGEETGL